MLAQEDIKQIEQIVEQLLSKQPERQNANVRYELDLRERTVRVEEELKHQRGLMIQGFELMEKRFEQMEKRFGQMDKRIDQVDKRLEVVENRFEQMDKKFVELRQDMNTGFMEMNKRLDRFMFWTLGLVISAVVFVVNYL